MAGAFIRCCFCGETFDERKLRGTWLERSCPRCSQRLSEQTYDDQAKDVLKRHRPQLGKRGRKKLDELAFGRYYTSEWFRLACASKGSESADKGLFGLRPEYAKDGTFTLVPDDADRSPEGSWGISAEYRVFDALRREIVHGGIELRERTTTADRRSGATLSHDADGKREASPDAGPGSKRLGPNSPASKKEPRAHDPLAGTRLVPHLVFPWLPGQKPQQWGARDRAEIDCVLMCESCAIVVEVKRHTHHVRASNDFHSIRERTDDGQFRSAKEVLEQVDNCVGAFAERQQLYPENRIFKLIVFVDPHSFKCASTRFRADTLISYLDDEGEHFCTAVRELASGFDAIASPSDIQKLADSMLERFGNTAESKSGSIVRGHDPSTGKTRKRTDAMLNALEKQARNGHSPLHGARLLRYPTCEVEMGKRGKPLRTKETSVSGILLTRTHAVLIMGRIWPVHVNTHVPFATVYTGDPKDGAKHIEDAIRHDWDLDEIRYKNRSGSLTMMTYLSKKLVDVERYRERNRVCTMNVFIGPTSFYSDCEEFRSRAFSGYWRKSGDNIVAALETLVSGAEPIMTQKELDRLADELAAIGAPTGKTKHARPKND